jgi:hypothetical protein
MIVAQMWQMSVGNDVGLQQLRKRPTDSMSGQPQQWIL